MACEGCGTSGCCCAPVSQFANSRVAGIHPEHVRHEMFVLSASEPSVEGVWGVRYQLVNESIHLVGLSAFADPNIVATSSDVKVVGIIFYTANDPDSLISYDSKHAVTLQPGESYTFSEDIVGSWYDYGMFAQVVGNSGAIGSGSSDDKVIINLSYVPREFYSPAYADSDHQTQHYWACNRTEDFQDNWNSGTGGSSWADSGIASTPDSGVTSAFQIGGGGGLDYYDGALFIVDQDGDPIQSQEEDFLSID